MNIYAGATRMRRGGCWIFFISLCLIAVALVPISAHYRLGPTYLVPPAAILVMLGLFGGLLWLAGWIVEGFGKSVS